ncbi:Inactivated superfamily I helicase [Rhodospirillaceae bacterium LM-1]|nr:Inactivated superfamily I helicase [Rhodospirillaceae bacterium LM-1]
MNVYSIAPGLAFVDVLAAGLLERAQHDPLQLSDYTVLLPTRRSIRALKDAFLRHAGEQEGGGALLLPRLMTLGDLDEDELVFSASLEAGLPPAIDPLRRKLLLARLIMAARENLTWDRAARLAGELARFLDQMQTQGIALERLDDLVPDDFADHWGEVLKFLGLLSELWPGLLAQEQAIDPAQRRNRLLLAQAEAWERNPPAGPVIAAGSTGSLPATAALLKRVASLEQGAVVLPGLDAHLEDAAWKQLDASHPQFGMKQLLDELGIGRDAVRPWHDALSRTFPARLKLVSEAFRPAAASDAWRSLEPLPAQALEGLFYLEAPDSRSEALAIALLLRKAAENRSQTAALVTPERDLARRVKAELERWGIVINDSAGSPLSSTGPGLFLRLVLAALTEDFAPVPLLALLKSPLTGMGLNPARLGALTRRLEIESLRGPRPAPGLASLLPAHDWLGVLDEAAKPLLNLLKLPSVPLSELVALHALLAERLSASDSEVGAARLWVGEAGEAALDFITRLMASAKDSADIPGAAYPALFDALLEEVTIRPAYGLHPRLHIWGPLEARLQQADLLILGGMNEGVWPALPPADPWLSRPMREKLGLLSPERRIGLAAHDAAQGLSAPEVILTRSARSGGAPTQPSRFIRRLEAVMNATGLLGPAGGEAWRLEEPLAWGEALDHAMRQLAVGPPAPCPPLEARPTSLSVTRIETWMRDPYALYAQKILRLEALDPIDADPGAADYGTLIHRVLELYVQKWPQSPPADCLGELLRLGEDCFRATLDRPGIWAFWWPRFKSVAAFVAALEQERGLLARRRFAECKGSLEVDDFTLTAKADRIDLLTSGGLSLIDYKTGAPPSWKQVKAGFAPQLPLEAAMLMAGAFKDVPKGKVEELAFWHLSGGQKGGGQSVFKEDVETLAQEALKGLRGLLAAYRRPETPYHACPTPGQAPGWSDYAHLERRPEWQSEEDAS